MELLAFIPNPFSWRTTLPFVAVCLGIALLMMLLGAALHSQEYKKSISLFGLYGVVGKFGRGKSYLLAWLAYDAMKRGRQVYTIKADPPMVNNDLRPMVGGKKGTERALPAIELEDWHDIVNVPDGSMVLLDEVQLWWPAESRSAPVEVKQWITQLRKHDITVVWASQLTTSVSTWLRKLSFGVFESSKFRKGHKYSLFECHAMRGEHNARCKSLSTVYLVRTKEIQEFYNTKAFITTGVEWGADGEQVRRIPPRATAAVGASAGARSEASTPSTRRGRHARVDDGHEA